MRVFPALQGRGGCKADGVGSSGKTKIPKPLPSPRNIIFAQNRNLNPGDTFPLNKQQAFN